MKTSRVLMTLTALGLAGTLAWAEPSFAQQGQGGPPRGRGQGAGPAWGAGSATCPNYPGYQKRLRGGAGKGQSWNCPRWGGSTSSPSQGKTPAPQSGN